MLKPFLLNLGAEKSKVRMKAVKEMPTAAETGLNNWVWSQIIFKPTFFKTDK